MFGKTRIERALAEPAKTGAGLADALARVDHATVTQRSEAELIVQCLRFFPLPVTVDAGSRIMSPLHSVLTFFQNVKGDAAAAVFMTRGMPELVRIYSAVRAQLTGAAAQWHDRDDLLFLCKQLTAYAPDDALPIIVAAARDPIMADGYLWSVIFAGAAEAGHPWREKLFTELSAPLPAGHAVVAFLDFANTVCREDDRHDHPFASAAGSDVLRQFLTAANPDEFSYAHSAAAALPFLGPGLMAELLPVVFAHPDGDVRLEAAWAAVRAGMPDMGLPMLTSACEDARSATRACSYLEELGLADHIPASAQEEDFQAMAEFCAWLAHPSEFGRAPDEIELKDTRVLYWPPTNDERRVWLFEYRYNADVANGEPDTGLGMVGSVTFALFGEATAELSPEQAYGLHCAWELEMNQDRRAPAARSPEAGLFILRKFNKWQI